MSYAELDTYERVLRARYLRHEIDATEYASLSEDIAVMRKRVAS